MIIGAHGDYRPEDFRFARQQSRYGGKLVASRPVFGIGSLAVWHDARHAVRACLAALRRRMSPPPRRRRPF